ncbi:NACHT domain-containing protein [Streptomyces sp. NBC_01361]|uniref:NACHT domain-containing protein n=1 Tax=Streptomyces sp. NBC_01361 TaxID=2903838 RepID=UPI002E2F469D|nr:helix-turn-helix domain-containing protein [Streptomyces sp. NBC_01361]
MEAGPGGALEGLAQQLRAAMTGRRLRQSDLAERAGVSPATVSNVFNLKSVPTVDTLDLLAHAVGITGTDLQQLHSLRERADGRTRRLDSYLAAALSAARDHPYAGVLPGVTPPLQTVYVRQQVQQRSGTPDPRALAHTADQRSVPAESVLAVDVTCVVVAGPGGGKTSLLRTWVAESAKSWLTGHGGGTVPVLVDAADLHGAALADAVACAVSKEMVEALPPRFFAAPPQQGVRWQILIDGLDEVTDLHARRDLLRRLAAVSEGPYADLYRFVIATRPLPPGELTQFGDHFPRYDLLPFDRRHLPEVATAWFGAVGHPSPGQAADRFIKALERTQLTSIARNPLMTAMLCQLHAATPEQPLPTGRAGIYRRFIALLHARQYSPRTTNAAAELCAGLARYGPAVLESANRVLDRLPDLIGFLAVERHHGNGQPTLDIVKRPSYTQVPRRVPEGDWRAFLDTALRRSGLLTRRGNDLVFLHQTLREYLAAQFLARNEQAARRALDDVFTVVADSNQFPPVLQAGLSYAGFLLEEVDHEDLLNTEDEKGRTAQRQLRRRVRYVLEIPFFIADLVVLGSNIPADLVSEAINHLAKIARTDALEWYWRDLAARALTRLGDKRGAEALEDLARDLRAHAQRRQVARRALYQFGDARSVEALYTLTADTRIGDSQFSAIKALLQFGSDAGREALQALSTDSRLGRHRVEAARALCKAGDPRGVEELAALAHDAGLGWHRVEAARLLAGFGDARGVDILRHLAHGHDPNVDERGRMDAARSLAVYAPRFRNREP